jgi:thiol:disulfide interchange protein DsbC
LSKGLTPPAAVGPCDSSVLDRNLALGARFGLNGTPAIIFEDGSMHNGAMPPAQLENALQTRKALK